MREEVLKFKEQKSCLNYFPSKCWSEVLSCFIFQPLLENVLVKCASLFLDFSHFSRLENTWNCFSRKTTGNFLTQINCNIRFCISISRKDKLELSFSRNLQKFFLKFPSLFVFIGHFFFVLALRVETESSLALGGARARSQLFIVFIKFQFEIELVLQQNNRHLCNSRTFPSFRIKTQRPTADQNCFHFIATQIYEIVLQIFSICYKLML